MEKAHNWTIKKWNFLKKYLSAYTTIVSCHFPRFIYIDLCAGKGKYDRKDGSPIIALKLDYPFTEYIFVEPNHLEELKKNIKSIDFKKAIIFRDSPKQQTREIKISFNSITATDYINNHLDKLPDYPSFIFIDPDGIEEIDIESIAKCAKRKRAELFINFSISGVIRNIKKEDTHPTLTKFYGHEKWKSIPKVVNKEELYAKLYIESLSPYFKHISYKIIKNDNNVPIYYLIHATNNDTGFKIMKHVMKLKEQQTKLNL